MWYYVKQALLPFIYLFFNAITAFGIICIQGADLTWLRVLLLILNIGLYCVIVCAASYKDGQEALKVRIANDLERVQIVKTGESLPLKLKEEYKPWKGFLFGLIACAPLVILLLIHTIVVASSGSVAVGGIAGFIYMMVFGFAFAGGTGTGTVLAPSTYYISLIAIPLIMLATGIPYVLGGKKIELQQQRIKEKQRSIYGD